MTPLALEMLLAFASDRPCIDADSLDAVPLVEAGLIEALRAVDGGGAYRANLTDRGEAFVAMLTACPLPVQQWVDPRQPSGGRIAGDDFTAVTYEFTPGGLDIPRRVAREDRIVPGTALEVPTGFTLVPHDIKPGDIPAGLDRDNLVEVLRANGKRARSLASTVPWAERDKKDSPVAFKDLGEAPE